MTINIGAGKLQNLSNDIKMLVNDGVYSLYVAQGSTTCSFVLINDRREFFLLDDAGNIQKKSSTLTGIKVGDPVIFPDLRTDSMKVNYA